MGYQSIWNHRREEIERVLHEVKDEYPQAWQAAHNSQRGDKRQREEYCQRVCLRLRALGIPAGMNGKRGNPDDLSEDIIVLPNEDGNGRAHGGATDTSGRWAAIEIRDIIQSAGPDKHGNQNGRPAFGDVTEETMRLGTVGCYVEPTPQPGQPERPPVGGDISQPPVVPPPVPNDPRVALLEQQVAELRAQNANILTGIGAIATSLGNLEGKLLNHDGAFDTLTKRIFGVGMDDLSVAEEVVAILQNLEPDQRTGALEGCRVHPRLRK